MLHTLMGIAVQEFAQGATSHVRTALHQQTLTVLSAIRLIIDNYLDLSATVCLVFVKTSMVILCALNAQVKWRNV